MKSQHNSQFKSLNVDYKPQIPARKYMIKVSIRNTRKRCEICSKLIIIKTPELGQ